MNECEKILNQVCGDLSEDVNSELCDEIKSHLKECDQCRKEIESMRGTVALFQCLETRKVPIEMHQRLAKLLNVDLPLG